MLGFGGIGLFLAGLIIILAGSSFIKDPEKAAKARKQAPIIMVIGAIAFAASFFVEGLLAA